MRSRIAMRVGAVASLLCVCAVAGGVSAASGPDPTFGPAGTGTVLTPVGTANASARATAVQPDGKVVAVGDAVEGSVQKFALTRYLANGTLDPAFGTGGKALHTLGTAANARAVVAQPDGRLIVAGFAVDAGTLKMAAIRVNPNGALDTTFGVAGRALHTVGTGADANAVALLPDGKIVAGGRAFEGGIARFGLIRMNPNGTLDAGFGNGGRVITPLGTLGDEIRALLPQPDGKLVAVGKLQDAGGNKFALARYQADGSLDPSFGSGGTVATPIGDNANAQARAAVLVPDGRIVAVGMAVTADAVTHFAFARYKPDGRLDESFSGGTVLTTPPGLGFFHEGNAAVLQPDGRIAAVGLSSVADPMDPLVIQFATVRVNADGSVADSILTGIGNGSDAQAHGVALAPDGKLVVAGSAVDGGVTKFALARYLLAPVVGVSDLAISASVAPANPFRTQAISYTLTVSNLGPGGPAPATVVAVLPGSVTFRTLSAPPGAVCKAPPVGASGTVSCSLFPLSAGASAPIVIGATAATAVAGTLTATVTTSSTDPDPQNNSASATITTG